MSALMELAYDAVDHLEAAIEGRDDVAGVQECIDALHDQAAQGSPELPATIGRAAAMLAELEVIYA